MTAETQNIKSPTAADAARLISELAERSRHGEDVVDLMTEAVSVIDNAECRSMDDAVAFLVIGRRLLLRAECRVKEGGDFPLEATEAATRYMAAVVDFLGSPVDPALSSAGTLH